MIAKIKMIQTTDMVFDLKVIFKNLLKSNKKAPATIKIKDVIKKWSGGKTGYLPISHAVSTGVTHTDNETHQFKSRNMPIIRKIIPSGILIWSKAFFIIGAHNIKSKDSILNLFFKFLQYFSVYNKYLIYNLVTEKKLKL